MGQHADANGDIADEIDDACDDAVDAALKVMADAAARSSEGAGVRDMVVAYAHSACSAAAYPNTSVEQRWLRDRWLAALDALGTTEDQARAECRAAMRGIYAERPSSAEGDGAGMAEPIALSPEQVELARHALGLPNSRRLSYRNHFVTGPGPGNDDHAQWAAMVGLGAATRRDGKTLPFGGDDQFRLTQAGAEAVLKRGERLCPEDFPPLATSPAHRRPGGTGSPT